MKLMSSSKKKQMRVVLGDDTGVVQCFGMKKGEVNSAFKTLPTNKEINRIELAGMKGEKNKIFASSGASIRGLTKKGKEFFKFNTNLTETIHSLYIEEEKIWCGFEYIYSLFVDCRDQQFYMANDRINDLIVERILNDGDQDAVLACQDRFVRVIHESNLQYEAPVDGAPMALFPFSTRRRQSPSGAPSFNQGHDGPPDGVKEFIYGTDNGLLGLIALSSSGYQKGWTVPNQRKLGGINCLAAYDLTKDGLLDIMVGRDDGNIEVYGFDVSAEPRAIFQKSIQESITSIEVGVVANPAYEEVVLATYAGKVLSYTSEPAVNQALELERAAPPPSMKDREKASEAKNRKVQALRSELDKLRERVSKEKEKYSKMSQELIAVQTQFKINDKFSLDGSDACYSLTIEIQTPIDVIALQSDCTIDLLDVDTNVAIVSRCAEASDDSTTRLLATYRCQESVSRLEMRFRTTEGQYGSLQAFVIPRVTPKTAQIVTYGIKPLSLHQRLNQMDEEKQPLNELKFSGTFSLNEVHSWISMCLPEVPSRFQGDDISYAFRNTFLGTVLYCYARKGEGTFRSDSLSTLSILKEVITKEATIRKIAVKISFDIKDDSVAYVLKLLHPRLDYQRTLAQKVQLVEALKELKMQEEDIAFLAQDYKEVLENCDELERDYKNQPRRLEFLHTIVRDLYVDRFKFKGQDVRHRIANLNHILEQYDLDRLLLFFAEPVV